MSDKSGPGLDNSLLAESMAESLDNKVDSVVQGATEMGDAFTRSQDRSTDATAKTLTRIGSATGSIVATFSDIESMTATLAQHLVATQADAARILPMASNGDLLQSLILSPVTGAAAEGAVLTSVAALTVLVARSTGLGLIAVTIVSTYTMADAALQAGAVGIGFVFDASVAGVTSTVDYAISGVRAVTDGVVTTVVSDAGVLVAGVETALAVNLFVQTAKFALVTAAVAGAAGFTEELQSAWAETVDEFVAEPWLFMEDRGRFGERLGGNYSGEEAWSNGIDNFEAMLGSLGPNYDALLTGLIESAAVFGWEDGATLQTESSVGSDPQRRGALLVEMSEIGLEHRIPKGLNEKDWSLEDIQPVDLSDLLIGLKQVDSLGGEDEAVIRVMTQPGETGEPPTFTMVIPSTQQWFPWVSLSPNDTIGNLMIMQGSSALERVSAEALDAAMTTYYEDNKDHVSRADVFDAPVMLAGFSQGGIVAAAFAENRSDTYNVVQVLTAGSPIGNFDIPHDISVIAYEADPVSGADGTQNPERWETLTADNGGGGGLGSHDVLRYALLAESAAGTPQEQNKLDDFLGVRDDRVISDYYAVKESK